MIKQQVLPISSFPTRNLCILPLTRVFRFYIRVRVGVCVLVRLAVLDGVLEGLPERVPDLDDVWLGVLVRDPVLEGVFDGVPERDAVFDGVLVREGLLEGV